MKLDWDQIAVQDLENRIEGDRWGARPAVFFIFAVSSLLWGAIATAIIVLN